ncbi:MAG: nucleoside-diphosphate kinase [Firmicutes bacterium]|jgi:nucleoside-diphosphate kinase|nr:nucleoside-diphosphate kinase [Bacillota bacterium]
MEKTLVLIKPDAVKKNAIGNIIAMYEKNDLVVEDMYITVADKAILDEHYAEHVEKGFYPELAEFMSSGRIVVLKVAGEGAVAKVRAINGATNPAEAEEGTIRKAFGTDIGENAVHGSADAADAERELKIWFK